MSQSLFQQMVFCNNGIPFVEIFNKRSQSLFQQMVFCNKRMWSNRYKTHTVTILILVDGFLQFTKNGCGAIGTKVTILILVDGFLQYCKPVKKTYNYQQSQSLFQQMVFCNRVYEQICSINRNVTILILVDGFLQFKLKLLKGFMLNVTILILVDGFLQQIVWNYIQFYKLTSQSLFQQMVFCNSRENFSKFHFFMQKTCIQ